MPIKVYLDTQDYYKLYKNRTPEFENIYQYLQQKADTGEVEFAFSLPIISEFIQEYKPEFKKDRVERARLIKSLCKHNCFRSFDRIEKEGAFSNEGAWFPNVGDILDIEKMKTTVFESLMEAAAGSNRKAKRALNSKYARNPLKLFDEFPQLAGASNLIYSEIGIPVSKKFVEENMLIKYMAGKLSKEVVEKEFLVTISDPELFLVAWFEHGGKGKLFDMISNFNKSLENIVSKCRNASLMAKEARRSRKEFEQSVKKAGLEELFGDQIRELKAEPLIFPEITREWILSHVDEEKFRANFTESFLDAFVAYLRQNMKSTNSTKESDGADLFHAAYLPYCDLWRGDKAFSNTLIQENFVHKSKIVPLLTELPTRIEALLKAA